MWLINLMIVLLLILANGVFAMTELALLSSKKSKLQQYADEGKKSAQVALDFLERPTDLLSTVQVGITLIGIINGAFGGAALSAPLISWLSGFSWLAPYASTVGYIVVVTIITYLSLVVGELVPKRIALVSPERVTMVLAQPMRLFSSILRPFIFILSKSTSVIFRMIGLDRLQTEDETEDEVKQLLIRGTKEGTFAMSEAEQVSRVFAFHDQLAYELMEPRTVTEWIDLTDSPEQILADLRTAKHRNLPVGHGDLDHFVGYIDAKEILAAEQPIAVIESMIHTPLIVPKQLQATVLLERMRKETVSIAFVLDEYGGFLGMITLFDILEAFVGEITTVEEEPELVQRTDGSYLADGLLHIDDLKRVLGIKTDLPGEAKNTYHTVAGLVLYLLGEFPVRGSHVTSDGYRFEVVDLDGRRIDQILIERLEEPVDDISLPKS
ncbi:hemolysin family protein [Exiguobacterium sp. s166]|uniref:hemolysin family protein n=1 Tax=unclassified Exiguobacterium TaxID=2644629 RepID=UPI001BE80156|nr:hemolysin family protein [Exiguobacterium sp. s166]